MISLQILKLKVATIWIPPGITMQWEGSQFKPQIREQISSPDLHVFTLKFLDLKKTGFSP
jgi:hypothetical protein